MELRTRNVNIEPVTNFVPWVKILDEAQELKPYREVIDTPFLDICYFASDTYRCYHKYVPYWHSKIEAVRNGSSSGVYMVEVLFDKEPDNCVKIADVIVSLLRFKEEPITLYDSTQYR